MVLDAQTLITLRPNRTWAEVAQMLGSKPSTVRSFAARHGLTRPKPTPRADDEPVIPLDRYRAWTRPNVDVLPPKILVNPIPESEKRTDTAPLHLDGDSALVIGDTHIPYHNETLFWQAIKLVQKRFPKVRRLVIIGDWWDNGAFSPHGHAGHEADPNAMLRLGGNIIRAVGPFFDEIVFTNGNHDEWFANRLDANWDLELLINAAMGRDWPSCKITVTNLDYVYLGSQWILGHPKNYSGRGGQTPSDLADIWGRSIVTGHNHIVGLQPSKSGEFLGIDAGHCTRPESHFYQARRLGKYTKWQAGFVVIEDAYPHLFTQKWTNFEALLKD
jgi:hypothetical protein